MTTEYPKPDIEYCKEQAIKYVGTPRGDFYAGAYIACKAFLNNKETVPFEIDSRMTKIFLTNFNLGIMQVEKNSNYFI